MAEPISADNLFEYSTILYYSCLVVFCWLVGDQYYLRVKLYVRTVDIRNVEHTLLNVRLPNIQGEEKVSIAVLAYLTC